MHILPSSFLLLIANTCDSFGKARGTSLPVCHLAIVWHLEFLPRFPLLKPIMSHLRSHGLKIVIFLDDKLLIAGSRQACLDQLALLRRSIEDLAFTVSDKKSQLTPTTKISFLGFIIDSVSMQLFFCLMPKYKKLPGPVLV